MKRKLTQALMLALGFAGIGMLGSCKDYDEDKYLECIASSEKGDADLKAYVDQQDKALQALVEQLQKAQDDCKTNCQAKLTELNNLIVQLQGKNAELKNLIDTKADQTAVDALQTEVDGIKTQISTIISDVATLQTNVTTIQNDITLINQTLDNIKPRVEKNEQDIAKNVSDIAALQGDVASINSTIITIQGDITTLKGDVSTLQDDVTNIKNDITTLKTAVTEINSTLASHDSRITEAQQTASDALALANSNKTYIENVEAALNDYKSQTDGHLTTVDGRLDDLEAAVADLQSQIDELKETAAKNFQTAIAIAKQLDAELKAEMLQEIANSIADYDVNLQQQLLQIVNDINARIDAVEQGYQNADANLQSQIDAIDAAYKAADAALKSELLQKIADAKQEVLDILNPKIADLQSQIDALVLADADLQGQIDELAEAVQANAAAIAQNSQRIDDLTGRMSNVESALNKLVTGIIVQGAYNPVYGTFAAPVGIKSNVLMAFVGKTTEDVSFPTQQTGNMPFPEQVLTDYEAAIIGDVMNSYERKGGKDLISPEADNAGTLYVTVNPNTVDFTGATLKLQNSVGKSAGVELKPLEVSNHTLDFGYTRAAGNAFYEAKAYINPKNIDAVQQLNLDKSKFKQTASDLIHNRTFSLNSFANAVYDELNGIIDANAVVAEYTNVNGETSKIFSEYSLAATAVHPLSYSFAKDYAGRQTLPGYNRVENFIDRMANRVNNSIDAQWPDLSKYLPGDDLIVKIEKITKGLDYSIKFSIRIQTDGENTRAYKTQDGTLEYLVVETKVPNNADVDVDFENEKADVTLEYGWKQIMKMALNDADASVDASGDVKVVDGKTCNTQYDLTINKKIDTSEVQDELNNIIGDVNASMDKVQDFLDDVNDMLDEINNFQTSLNDKITDIADQLKSYLERINNKGIHYVDALIARLQPVLLVSTPDGAKVGVEALNYPTVVNSTSLTLIPTSYTAEIITPAFKKHVACVDVRDKNGKQVIEEAKKLNADNADLNSVKDGAVQKINVKNLKSGYSYKFVYSALDYSGKICVKRAWVRVK